MQALSPLPVWHPRQQKSLNKSVGIDMLCFYGFHPGTDDGDERPWDF